MDIEWIDLEREPQCAPNPAYPYGKDIGCEVEDEEARVCSVDLPYPAKRCGVYVVTCERCGLKVCVTTAGRPDDPRSLTMACRLIN